MAPGACRGTRHLPLRHAVACGITPVYGQSITFFLQKRRGFLVQGRRCTLADHTSDAYGLPNLYFFHSGLTGRIDVMAKSRDAIGRDGRSDGDELDRFGVHLILPRALKSAPLATYLLRKMYGLR
jgi:hypothetical protein